MFVYVQAHLGGSDLWLRPYSDLRASLLGASQALARLASEAEGLTRDWTIGIDNGGHDWSGQPYRDTLLQGLISRLEEVRLAECIPMYTVCTYHGELELLPGICTPLCATIMYN